MNSRLFLGCFFAGTVLASPGWADEPAPLGTAGESCRARSDCGPGLKCIKETCVDEKTPPPAPAPSQAAPSVAVPATGVEAYRELGAFYAVRWIGIEVTLRFTGVRYDRPAIVMVQPAVSVDAWNLGLFTKIHFNFL